MTDDAAGQTEPPFMPTLEEIREACERIQATWSKREKRKRCAWQLPGHPIPLDVEVEGSRDNVTD